MRSLAFALVALAWTPTALADTEIASARLFAALSARPREAADVDKFIAAVAKYVSDNRDRRLRVIVHCDERSGAVDNTALAFLRAKALAKALRQAGAGKKQVVAESVGHSGVEHTPETSRIVFDFNDDASVSWPSSAPAAP